MNNNLLGFFFINFLKYESLKRAYQIDEKTTVSTNVIIKLAHIQKIYIFKSFN